MQARRTVELMFLPTALDQVDLLERLIRYMKQSGLQIQLDTTQFGRLGGAQFLSEVRAVGRWRHGFETEELEVSGGYVGVGGVDLYKIYIEEKRGNLLDPRLLVVRCFLDVQNFFSARVADSEFEYWQNADSPVLYESRGRSYASRKLISNGLPYPLEELIVDTSKNPGRRLFLPGYIEALGQEMWLSRVFLKRIGEPSDVQLLAAGWTLEKLTDGIWHITAPDGVLQEDGPLEEQKILRKALFGMP